MVRRWDIGRDYAVLVQTEPGCTWIVNRANQPALSGPAPDPESARRRGVFAAGALHALDQIGRRGF